MLILCPQISDVTCNSADAAHADAAVSASQQWAAQASGGRRSRWTTAEISREEQSSGNKMQTEEKSVGDVIREESWRAHSDQYAASGTNLSFWTFPQYPLLLTNVRKCVFLCKQHIIIN